MFAKMFFQKRSKMPNFALIFWLFLICVAGIITDDSVKSEKNKILPNEISENFERNINDLSIKQLIEPFAKRRSSFLPSRGKKLLNDESTNSELVNSFVDDDFTGEDSKRIQFIDQVMNKRGSSAGFMPMRGRKSNLEPLEQDFYTDALEQELDALNTFEKRRSQSFMPMRGRKFDHEFPRFYHRVVPFKANTNFPAILNSQMDSFTGYGQKRKGMGFFGARGKRSSIQV